MGDVEERGGARRSNAHHLIANVFWRFGTGLFLTAIASDTH